MSWHDKKMVIEIDDENGERITEIEMTKAEFVYIEMLAEHNGLTAEEQFQKLLMDHIKGVEDEETTD